MSRPRGHTYVGRVVLVVASAILIAVLGLRCGFARVIDVHPAGSTSAPYGYVEYVPEVEGVPLVIVLHGSGLVGDGSDPRELIDRLPPLREVALARLFGLDSGLTNVRIVAPQSPGPWDVASLDAFVEHVVTSRVDRDRVYVTGLSMGGCGAWRYAAAHPERLAAMIAICGGCPGSVEEARRLDTLPIRAFHAFDDGVVPNYMSATWVSAAAVARGAPDENAMMSYRRSDATAVFDGTRLVWRDGDDVSTGEALTLTMFAGGGHDVWRRVYRDERTWRWLFAQRRSAR